MYKGIIYRALFPNGKQYYGKTTMNFCDRIAVHLKDAQCDHLLFHKALNKYGDKVDWQIVEELEDKNKTNLVKRLDEREKFWIEKDKTFVLKYGIKYGHILFCTI